MYKALVRVLEIQMVGQKQTQEVTTEPELEVKVQEQEQEQEQEVRIEFHSLRMALLMQQGFGRIELIQVEKPMTVPEKLEDFGVVA